MRKFKEEKRKYKHTWVFSNIHMNANLMYVVLPLMMPHLPCKFNFWNLTVNLSGVIYYCFLLGAWQMFKTDLTLVNIEQTHFIFHMLISKSLFLFIYYRKGLRQSCKTAWQWQILGWYFPGWRELQNFIPVFHPS